MKISTKINTIAIGAAATVVLSLWNLWDSSKDQLSWKDDPFLEVVVGAFLSTAFFRLVLEGIIWLTKKSKLVKKYILGAEYLEGTWVGFYINGDNHLRYYIETVEHDLYNESLIVSGQGFDEHRRHHARWEVISSKIDVQDGKLFYMYYVHPTNKAGHNIGVSDLTFKRKNRESAPTQMYGTSVDAQETKKIRTMGMKIHDELEYNQSDALNKAIEFYNSNRDF